MVWRFADLRVSLCLEKRATDALLPVFAGHRPVRASRRDELRGTQAPVEPADPARYLENLNLDFGLLDWADDLDGRRDGEYGPSDYGHDLRGGSETYATSGAVYAPCSYKKRARLLAWINGDWG
ncbi:hypothetical protein ACFPZI_15535 [Streptomyces chlorus]|uniref:Uncharacterized protein n=1 Tax=Streptomyces chlorus TaxID=887452 RepID=A0ABW1DYG1_9ACTN